MAITTPAFVVAELPDSVAVWVRSTREVFEPGIAHLPAEITLAGSSGVGPITIGQDIESTRAKLEAALRGCLPFEARFTSVGTFPGTNIFFASPEPEPFVARHQAIVDSGVAFGSSPFPYSPHCSLKGLTALRPGQREALLALSVPASPFTIEVVSVYAISHMQPTRLFSMRG
jgi:hypothetical protein